MTERRQVHEPKFGHLQSVSGPEPEIVNTWSSNGLHRPPIPSVDGFGGRSGPSLFSNIDDFRRRPKLRPQMPKTVFACSLEACWPSGFQFRESGGSEPPMSLECPHLAPNLPERAQGGNTGGGHKKKINGRRARQRGNQKDTGRNHCERELQDWMPRKHRTRLSTQSTFETSTRDSYCLEFLGRLQTFSFFKSLMFLDGPSCNGWKKAP